MPVRVLGTAKFKAETRTLPDEVFTTGIELPPDKIVGVRSYEDSGGLEFIPALGLIGYSGRGTTNVYNKIGEAAAIGLTFSIGGAAAGGAGAVSWGTRALVWIERAAHALMLLGLVLNDPRTWLNPTSPNTGPQVN